MSFVSNMIFVKCGHTYGKSGIVLADGSFGHVLYIHNEIPVLRATMILESQ